MNINSLHDCGALCLSLGANCQLWAFEAGNCHVGISQGGFSVLGLKPDHNVYFDAGKTRQLSEFKSQ